MGVQIVTTGNQTRIEMQPNAESATLVIRNRDAGFFSNLNAVVDCLINRLGRDGVEAARVDWRVPESTINFHFGTAAGGNLWAAFFEPLPFAAFPARTVETESFVDNAITGRSAYATYKLKRRWRQRYHRAFARYVKPRRLLLDKVERVHRDRMDGHFCVGVHCRHPGHGSENLFPIPDPDAFIARVKRLLPSDRSWRVFLATDNQAAVTAFDAAFGRRLIVQPGVSRSESAAEKPHNIKHENPNTGFGEEALVDCLLLARCDVLVHVTSNLATASGYINPDMKMVYCEAPHRAVMGYLWAIGRTLRAIHRYRFLARAGAAD